MAKKIMRSLMAVLACMAIVLSALQVPAYAKKDDKKTGTGQTQVHIHKVGQLGGNGTMVTIYVDGNAYSGPISGSKLTLEMNSTDNGFDFPKGGSMDVRYSVETGETGTLTLTHKEGNGNNIKDEHDQGLNNFNAEVKPDQAPKDEEPKDEEPKDEEPKDEEPKDEEPKDEEPKDEEPKDEEPKDEEPKDEEPKDEEPKDEKSTVFVHADPAPTSDEGELEEIPDEDVPLADVPQTGGSIFLWTIPALLSLAGLFLLTRKKAA